jgi:histidinol phosphatase-like enzyme (inositol monophosphatase family)
MLPHLAASPALRAQLLRVAEALADIAAAHSLPLFRSRGLAVEDKGLARFDPVTEADRAAEAAMRAHLAETRPEDGVLGEEFGPRPGTSGLTWVIDPIDGTRAFVSGAPSWGTLIGLDAGAGPVLGLVDQPFTGERFLGGFGRAVLRRGGVERPLAVRPCDGLAAATLFTTFPEIGSPAERAGFEAVRDRVRLTRYGLDCYAYALVALGQIDLVIEAGLQAYDIQGPQAVIEAAGGIVTDWRGGPAHRGGRVIAAGDARAHAEALALLARVSD